MMPTVEDFEPLVGREARFEGPGVVLTLTRAQRSGSAAPGGRDPFILIFEGPRDSDFLPEGLHACAFEDGPTHELYVNPIHTPNPDRQEYQAVFN
jgi:hypothetical protein